MKSTLLACGLLAWPLLGLAVEISVGEARLSIPPPAGYAPVTGEMQPYADFARRFVPPSNEQFALFLTPADVATAARGGIPQPERWFYVQTTQPLIRRFVSTAEFAQLKKAMKSENDDFVKRAEAEMPALFEKLSQSISNDYQVDFNLALDQMIPLRPHYENERGLAYSTFVKYKATDETGKPSELEGVVTATFVHVQGKVLFLYANAEKAGLEWSRAESRQWADAVIAANPSTGDVAVREQQPLRSRFDWSRVFLAAIVGGVAGGVTMLFRKKSTPT